MKGSSHGKKIKKFYFLKNGSNDFDQFCGFIVHSKPNNVTLSAFPEKIPETEKKSFIILCGRCLTERLTHLTNLVQIRYLGPLANFASDCFHFRVTFKTQNKTTHNCEG